jgi:flagellin-like hook-associated protein FlgL
MSDIVLSKGIRSNLLSLQNASAQREVTQTRLATGRKVNTALDDPLNYFQSANLGTRGRDLSRLLDNIGLGLQTIKQADNGLTAMTRLVEQMQAGLRTALTSNATNARLSSGMNTQTLRAIDYVTNPNLLGTATPPGPVNLNDQLLVTFTVPSNPVVAATTMTFTMGAVGPPAINTVQDLANAINAAAVNNNVATGERYVNASVDAGGRLIVDNTTTGSLRLQWNPATANTTNLNSLFGTFEPPLVGSTPLDTGTIQSVANPTRAKFAEQYNDMLAQLTNLAKDASFNGTNLLYGQTLDMVFNEESTTRLLVRGVVFDAAGLGLAANDTRRNMQSDTEINAGLARLTATVKQIRAQQATFAANNTVAVTRQDFMQNAIKFLKEGSDDLVVADMNEEGANLLALQTRQQLSTQALSLASQSDQAILRLFS